MELRAEDGYELWLRYRKVEDAARLAQYRVALNTAVVLGSSPTTIVIKRELRVRVAGIAWCERTFLTNVNADARSLTPEYLEKIAALADVFRPYGLRIYLSPDFAAPIRLGGLSTRLDLNNGQGWPIRPTSADEEVGHEYWFKDGIRIGYHGRSRGQTIYGSIRYDNSERVEAPFPVKRSSHFSSNVLELIVGDSDSEAPYLLLWRFRDGAFEGPRILAHHRGSFHVQIVHVHPAFSPDGKQVIYTCDPDGYGQVHLVDVPDFGGLPVLEEILPQGDT